MDIICLENIPENNCEPYRVLTKEGFSYVGIERVRFACYTLKNKKVEKSAEKTSE